MHMEDEPCEEQNYGDSGQGQNKICEDAGGKHVAGGDGSHVKTAQDALLAVHYQSGAQAPKTTHDVEGEYRAKEDENPIGVALGEDAGVKKEEKQRHHYT